MDTLLEMIAMTHSAAFEAVCLGFMEEHENYARLYHRYCDLYERITDENIRESISPF